MLNSNTIELPITSPTGKVRVKRRSHFSYYGIPVATRTTQIQTTDYIEWQIGYDVPASSAQDGLTSLTQFVFLNSKEKPEKKHPYELSEILYYSYKNRYIGNNDIRDVYEFISDIEQDELLDLNPNMQICRTNPVNKKINKLDFYAMEVRYPLIVNKFRNYDIYTEVINREKQRGVGNQPMLYLCIPLTSSNLSFSSVRGTSNSIIGRTADEKEKALWKITADEAELSLLLFKIFGMLSARHQHDVKAILKVLFPHLQLR